LGCRRRHLFAYIQCHTLTALQTSNFISGNKAVLLITKQTIIFVLHGHPCGLLRMLTDWQIGETDRSRNHIVVILRKQK